MKFKKEMTEDDLMGITVMVISGSISIGIFLAVTMLDSRILPCSIAAGVIVGLSPLFIGWLKQIYLEDSR